MQFIDLPRQYGLISDKIEAAISEVLSGGQYIMGEAVHLLEKELEDFFRSAMRSVAPMELTLSHLL